MRLQLLVVALAVASPAASEVLPTPGGGDPRIQLIAFDPEQVVTLSVAGGYSVAIQFSPDERIEIVSLGNSGAWQATPSRRGDFLFVKPLQGGIDTNMTVVTDSRHYYFKLQSASFAAPELPFSVRFIYPVPTVSTVVAVEPALTRYRLKGARALRPSQMSDDGLFTRIVWPVKSTMPAVYLIDADGEESIANGTVRDGAYVIEGVANRLVFRLGEAEAGARRQAVPPRR